MRRNWMIGAAILVTCGMFVRPLVAQERLPFPQELRRPRGVYAKINISSEISDHPKFSPSDLNDYFNNLYQQMLENPAVAGLALQVHWDTLNPNPPETADAYNWTYLDDAFEQVKLWNGKNPFKPRKTIQFIMTPGFQSPQWVFDRLPSCDGLFELPVTTPPSNCGRVTFVVTVEEQDSNQLPLPWNTVYKSLWRNFLVVLNERYGENPALVSIAVSGPSASSEEMIVPNDNNASNPQTVFGNPPVPATPISPDGMWLKLLAFRYPNMPAFRNSDQAFIDEWDAAIDMYAEIFHGLTLIVTTGSGLPNFATADPIVVPPAFTDDCLNVNMDCAAETTILSHFVEQSVGGFNAKGTQTSGLEARRADNVDLGLNGVKLISQATAHFQEPSLQILGGVQFNTSFSTQPDTEGSSSIPEQALFNVLQVVFSDTQVAGLYCGTKGAAPLNYVQVYSTDFLYAANNGATPVQLGDCGSMNISAQEELNIANRLVFAISEPSIERIVF
jgi:hypothetical protein